jgi:rhodanese-related sulfurtransferase
MVRPWSPEQLSEKLKKNSPDFLLLDVREPFEREMAVIEPSTHIPMDDVPEKKDTLPADAEIVVYCHHGTRSMAVAGYLEANGFSRVGNLTGGIDAWSRKVDQSVPQYF